jgi:hypothetical protein
MWDALEFVVEGAQLRPDAEAATAAAFASWLLLQRGRWWAECAARAYAALATILLVALSAIPFPNVVRYQTCGQAREQIRVNWLFLTLSVHDRADRLVD